MITQTTRIPRTPIVPFAQIDLVIASILSLLSLIHSLGFLRVAAGILVTTFIPGYLFGLCVFPRQSQLREIERWGLALIVSTCFAMFLPFTLSAIGWGVSTDSYSISIGGILLVMVLIAVVRRRNVPDSMAYCPRFLFTATFGWMTLSVAAIATLVTLVVRYDSTMPTAFFVTNAGGTLRQYPFNVMQGQKLVVQLHIANPNIRVLQGLVEARDPNGIFFRRNVSVTGHANLVISCSLPSQEIGKTEKVSFLFHANDAADSRSLWITYHVIGR